MFLKSVFLLSLFVITVVGQLTLDEQWDNFKRKFKKSYEDDEEEAKRFAIFQENLKRIEEHNKKYKAGEVSWYMGVTRFADLTDEEFNKFVGSGLKEEEEYSNPRCK